MISQHLRAMVTPMAMALCLVYIPHLAYSDTSARTFTDDDPLASMVLVLCPDMFISEDITGPGCTAMVTIPAPDPSPGCPITNISNSTGMMDPSGLYADTSFMITWQVEDCMGMFTCMQLVVVNDISPPDLTAPADSISMFLPPEPQTVTELIGQGGSVSDNCAIDSSSLTVETTLLSTSGSVGFFQRRFTISDVNGNVSQDFQSLSIDVNAQPILICPPDTAVDCSLANFGPYMLLNNFTFGGGNVVAAPTSTVDGTTFHLVRTDTLQTMGCPAYDRIYGIQVDSDTITCTQRVDVIDMTPPVIAVCMKDSTVAASSSQCNRMVDIDTTGMFITDNCMIDSISNTLTLQGPVASALYPVGTTDVTFTVYDACGNTSSCSFTVTVLDTTPPELIPPADTLIICDINTYDYDSYSTYLANGGSASDNCMVDTMSFSTSISLISSTSCPDVYEITYLLSDTSGNEGSAVQTVMVNDTLAPIIDSVPPMVLYTGADTCVAMSTLPMITVSDDCSLADTSNSLHVALDSVITWSIDTTMVDIYVEDSCGNRDSVTLEVIVLDTVSPIIDTMPNVATAICGMMEVDTIFTVAEAEAAGAVLSDNCMLSDSIALDSIATTAVSVTRYYTVSDLKGNMTTMQQVILLNDTIPPMLTLAADVTIACGLDTLSFFDTIPTSAMDNCAVVDTLYRGPLVLDPSPCAYVVGYEVTIVDQMGLMAKDTQRVTVEDKTPPVLGPLAGLPDTYCALPKPAPEQPALTDACSATMPVLTEVDSTRKVACANYPIIYEYIAMDVCNNADTLYDTIMVLRDTVAPTLLAALDTVRLDTDPFTCEATYALPLPSAVDDCRSGVITTRDYAGNTYPLDTTIVHWTISDNCNNDTVVPQVVIVDDKRPPTITVSGPKIVALSNNVPNGIVADTFAGLVFDNCTKAKNIKITGMKIDSNGDPITNCGDTSTDLRELLYFCCEDIGQDVFVMLQAEDLRGNTTLTAAFRVTVEDNVGPVTNASFDLPDITVSCEVAINEADLSPFGAVRFDLNARDSIIIDGQYWGLDAYVLDNCPANTTVHDSIITRPEGTCGHGQYVRHLSVDDGTNAPLIVDQIITVVDNSPVVLSDITFPSDTTILDCATTTIAPSLSGVPLVANNDKCANVFYNHDDQLFTQQNGDITIQRTWTVVDWCQNMPNSTIGSWTGVQTINIVCTSGRIANVGGAVVSSSGQPMQGVELYLEGPEMEKVIVSDEDGAWDFSEIPSAYSYSVTPQYDDNHREGVTTLDLVKMMRHILGLEVLDLPQSIIAGDVNNDERLSGSDVVLLRRLILGVDPSFDQNNSYRFVAPGYTWPNNSQPWGWEESWVTGNLLSDRMDLQFEAIKIGDVDNSFSTDNRSANATSLIISPPIEDGRGGYSVHVTASADMDMSGLELHLDGEGVRSVSSQVLPDLENCYATTANSLHIAWATGSSVVVQEGEQLFTIQLEKAASLASISGTIAELYTVDYDRVPVELIRAIEGGSISLEQNTPNPFSNQTIIRWTQSKEGRIQLRLHDASGALIHRHIAKYPAGHHSYDIAAEDIDPTQGVIIYSIRIEGEKMLSRQMLRIH